ncbi:MAG: DUF2089 domain-containing protein [Chloroflexota bacterium]
MVHEVLGQCPVCGEALEVTKLQCPSCRTSVEGRFSLDRFARLSREQLQFLEAFLRARGVIKDVEEALGISYPTVRGRLDELLRTLDLGDDRERERERRRVILADLSDGTISSEQAMSMLAALKG